METIQGLKPIITEGKGREGYEIRDLQCVKCGDKVSVKESEKNKEKCPNCRGTTFKELGKVSKNDVEKIINRKLQYKCETCGKVYDQPTQCCNGNYEINGEKMVWAYFCTGCKRVYSQPVKCCEGFEILEGYYKPESWLKHQFNSGIILPR